MPFLSAECNEVALLPRCTERFQALIARVEFRARARRSAQRHQIALDAELSALFRSDQRGVDIVDVFAREEVVLDAVGATRGGDAAIRFHVVVDHELLERLPGLP